MHSNAMTTIKYYLTTITLLYLTIILFLWAIPFWPQNLWWLGNLISVCPLWILALPLLFFIFLGLIKKQKSIIILNTLTGLILIFALIGFNLPLQRLNPQPSSSGPTLRILSANLGNSFDLRPLGNYIQQIQPDIIALQETSKRTMQRLKYYLPDNNWHLSHGGELALISRHPILASNVKQRTFEDEPGAYVAQYSLGPTENKKIPTINFFNIHLETPRQGLEAFFEDRPNAINKMQQVTQQQIDESQKASYWVSAHPNTLVAGDFNLTPLNPIYTHYWSDWQNTFSKAGLGFGSTKHTGWHKLRIDHILCNQDWRVLNAHIGPNIGGDHRPVVTTLQWITP